VTKIEQNNQQNSSQNDPYKQPVETSKQIEIKTQPPQ
jgi:hypothetical protein